MGAGFSMRDEALIIQYKNEPDPDRRRAILEKLRDLEEFHLAQELSTLLEREQDLGVKLLGRVIVNRLKRKHDFEIFGEEVGGEPDDSFLLEDEPASPARPLPRAAIPRRTTAATPSPKVVAHARVEPKAPLAVRGPVKVHARRGPFMEGLVAGWRTLPPALAVAALGSGLALLSIHATGLLAVYAHGNLPLQVFFALVVAGVLFFAVGALTAFAGLHYHRAARGEDPAAGDLIDEVLGEAQDLAVVSLIAFVRSLVALAAPAFAALLLGAALGSPGFAAGALLAALVFLVRAVTLAEAPLLFALRGHIPYEAVDRADRNAREHPALFLVGVAPWPLLAAALAVPLLLSLPSELPACLAVGLLAPGFLAALTRYHDMTYEPDRR